MCHRAVTKTGNPQSRPAARMTLRYGFSCKVGDVESIDRLTPVAINETAKQEAFALIGEGYVQASQVLECPHCSTRLLLLLDPRDRAALGQSEVEKRAADYSGTMMAAQHLTSHPLDRLTVPKQNCCN
jgi:hypothetical protein